MKVFIVLSRNLVSFSNGCCFAKQLWYTIEAIDCVERHFISAELSSPTVE